MKRLQRVLGWAVLLFAPVPVGLLVLRSLAPTLEGFVTVAAIITVCLWGFAVFVYGLLRLIHSD